MTVDPVLLEVLRNELLVIGEEMHIVMMRTTRSIMAREGGDHAAALLDASGNIIAQAVPFGFDYFITLMPHVVERFRGHWREGDVVITNDPYEGGSHLPDIIIVLPIFWEGEHCGFAAVAEHHTDIGGRFPGGMGSESESIFEEGLRLPLLRLYSGGVLNDAVRDIISANVREPEDVLGDVEAGVAACRRGERGMIGLLHKYGRGQLEAHCERLLSASEHRMYKALRSMANGNYSSREIIDDGRGRRFTLALMLTVQNGKVTIDFTGTSAQARNAINLPPYYVRGAVAMIFLVLLGDSEPCMVNAGLIRPISIIAPKGTLVNPHFPAAVGARGQLVNRVHDLLIRTIAKAAPTLVPADGEGGPSVMIFSPDAANGVAPSVLFELYAGGWGARADRDGIEGIMPAWQHFRTSPAEIIESELPVAVEGFGFVPDTGGAGAHRGALSVYRRWRFKSSGRVFLRTNRVDSLPLGRAGGNDGTPFQAVLISDGTETVLPAQQMLEFNVRAGDSLCHMLPGAGGYGSPLARSVDAVVADVVDEKISLEVSQQIYGVVFNSDTGEADMSASVVLRQQMAERASEADSRAVGALAVIIAENE